MNGSLFGLYKMEHVQLHNLDFMGEENYYTRNKRALFEEKKKKKNKKPTTSKNILNE